MSRSLKKCSRCQQVFDRSRFVKNKSSPDGLGSYCLVCHREVTARNTARRYGSRKNFLLQLRYGISEAEAEALLKEPGGLCAICGKREARHIDHDHASGQARGILCVSCNGGLGQFNDDPSRIGAVLDYLKKTTPPGDRN